MLRTFDAKLRHCTLGRMSKRLIPTTVCRYPRRLLLIPADPLVTVGQLQGRRRKSQAAKPPVAQNRSDSATAVPPGGLPLADARRSSSRSISASVRSCATTTRFNPPHLPGPRGHIDRRRHRLAQTPWRTAPVLSASSRQHEVPGPLQFPKCFQTTTALFPATGVIEPELLAYKFGQFVSVNYFGCPQVARKCILYSRAPTGFV